MGMGSVKTIDAAPIALQGDIGHVDSLDKGINTIRLAGIDMNRKFHETSCGGLAENVIERRWPR